MQVHLLLRIQHSHQRPYAPWAAQPTMTASVSSSLWGRDRHDRARGLAAYGRDWGRQYRRVSGLYVGAPALSPAPSAGCLDKCLRSAALTRQKRPILQPVSLPACSQSLTVFGLSWSMAAACSAVNKSSM